MVRVRVCLGVLGSVRVAVVIRGDPWLPLTIDLSTE